MAKRRYLNPKSLPQGADRSVGYAYGLQVGETIWVSGQVAKNERGELIGPGDPLAQAEQCLRNLAAVLAEAGATLDDIVQLNVFIKDAAYHEAVRQARKNAFRGPRYPTALIIEGAAAKEDYLIEMQAVAVLGQEEE